VSYEIERDPILADQSPRTLARRVEEVLSTLQRSQGALCADCAAALCGHQTIMSMVLGWKNAPKCLACLSQTVGRERDHLGDQLAAYILSKECLAIGWCWTKLREEHCPWSSSTVAAVETAGVPQSVEPVADVAWDAGDLGCGDLVLELRLRLQEMKPGQVMRVTARDPGAPEDMPAWCGLTGHALVRAEHPVYFIRRKEE